MTRTRASGRAHEGEPIKRITPYQRIKQAIQSGEFLPGQPLVESALAEWCEVSRTPIREALTRLDQDGLIHRTKHGLTVRDRSPEEILDIYETRMILEVSAAEFAAERRGSHDLLLLHRLVNKLDNVDSLDTRVETNARFHRTVWRAAHNDSLTELLDRLELYLARYPAGALSTPGRWERTCEQHRGLVEAIDARDTEEAARIAREHLAERRDAHLSVLSEDVL